MVLILFVQVLKKVLKSLKFELKYPGGTLFTKILSSTTIDIINIENKEICTKLAC